MYRILRQSRGWNIDTRHLVTILNSEVQLGISDETIVQVKIKLSYYKFILKVAYIFNSTFKNSV